MNHQHQQHPPEHILNDHIEKLDRQLHSTFRSIAAIINYNLQIRTLNINPFIDSSQYPPLELLEQLKLNLTSFDGTLQHIQQIATMAIAITRRDLDQAIQAKPPTPPPITIDIPDTQDILMNEQESEIEILSNTQPIHLISSQSPSPQPQPQPLLSTTTSSTTAEPVTITSSSLMDQLIPPLDGSDTDDQDQEPKKVETAAPIVIDIDRDSSPETALITKTISSTTKTTTDEPSTTNTDNKPTEENTEEGDPPGSANLDFKSNSDLTDGGDLFGDGSLFGSSHHGSVVPSPLDQHSHLIPSTTTTTTNDKNENIITSSELPLDIDNSTHQPLDEFGDQTMVESSSKLDPSSTVPASITPQQKPEQEGNMTGAQESTTPMTLPKTEGTSTTTTTMDMITSQAELSAFLSSFSHPSSTGQSTAPSPMKNNLERTSSTNSGNGGLIGLGIDLSSSDTIITDHQTTNNQDTTSNLNPQIDHHQQQQQHPTLTPNPNPSASIQDPSLPSHTIFQSDPAVVDPLIMSAGSDHQIDFASIFAHLSNQQSLQDPTNP
ncbi:hypothetical protein MJO28_005135 [Puccinia striiformis f. sp. tritici]|nr:hypothetical protein Pst134EA_009303 [Puccinia striiformis f. sp. tritici]KAI9622393.1 hypothetical protein KEM48_007284 [Puccinia striiformis f. sp. tritici PST-130]KNE91195.1 hypothetical protein PSTG_15359 [Puccinia striiformis f. sp. tritici PST-78]POW19513.1 hypothetical protein PSHT_04573 [Puccinia striiformis]KAH9458074.1 hypothetical protein Pst134EB_010377 [Puccinia striiformis f. sp. tritici]KAH9468771.1 hypothetical protein Pst134EA_009303 [Puccinia striiformis f. sp. tritici]